MSAEPWSGFLPAGKLNELYATGLSLYGGDGGPETPGCHARSVGSAWAAEEYLAEQDLSNRRGLLFAAHLLYYLAFNHCHSDGNKRLAWAASMYALSAAGLTLQATTDEGAEIISDILKKQIPDGLAVARWMADRLVAA
jgi:hypothetical protein